MRARGRRSTTLPRRCDLAGVIRRRSPDTGRRDMRRIGPGGQRERIREQMQRRNDSDIREQLASLRAEHRGLDDEIVALEGTGSADQLLIKRLKKKKLAVKDQITLIEDQLLPDIIA